MNTAPNVDHAQNTDTVKRKEMPKLFHPAFECYLYSGHT